MSIQRQRALEGEEAFAGWTYCYNLPLFARRVHDIMATIKWAKRNGGPQHEVDLIGLKGTGHLTAAVAAVAQGAITRAAINTEGFRFGRLNDVYDVDFVPGAAKYHDLPGLLALAAPTNMWVAGEDEDEMNIVRAAYKAAGASERFKVLSVSPRATRDAAIDWLLGGR